MYPRFSGCLVLLGTCLLASCDKPGSASPQAAPKAESATPKANPAPPAATTKSAANSAPDQAMASAQSAPVDIGEFGSDQPVEREELPSRGVIRFGPQDHSHSNQAHWESYVWEKFNPKRTGDYQVRLTYTLRRASLGMQFRIGDLVAKKPLKNSGTPRKIYLGDVQITQTGPMPFSMITAPSEDGGFRLLEVALIPKPSAPTPAPAADGSLVLEAKHATTWSELMRYEPQTHKNCLGYWTSVEDFADWSLPPLPAGKYEVTVHYGCGKGQGGSQLELRLGKQALPWKTEDTGGFQSWKPLSVGQLHIEPAATPVLSLQPRSKAAGAIVDIQKIVLTPKS